MCCFQSRDMAVVRITIFISSIYYTAWQVQLNHAQNKSNMGDYAK